MGWSWFRWGARGVGKDAEKAEKKEEGVYLGELAKDPAKMAEYFGRGNETSRFI